MIKGLFYILFFYFLGEWISLLIGSFIPGSIIGMVLLFLCLFFKILSPENVKDAASTITKNMAVFFVPAAVGVMAYGELISRNFWAILLAISISTVLTMAAVAFIQEWMENKNNANPLPKNQQKKTHKATRK